MQRVVKKFLEYNNHWASEKQEEDPHFFEHLAKGQNPIALLLGCSDSRVSPSVVLGGIRAAMDDEAIGLIDNWLANIKDVMATHQAELDAIPEEHDRLNRLVELNVLTQIKNLRLTSVFRQATKRGRELRLHAWVYDFSNGQVKVLEQEAVEA